MTKPTTRPPHKAPATHDAHATHGAMETSAAPECIVDSATLFAGQKVLNIRHAGRIYRLQQTRQGKLILTK